MVNKGLMSKRRTEERQDTDSSAGGGGGGRREEGEEACETTSRVAKGSSLHEKGKFIWLYCADTINFLFPFQQRKQEIKNSICNIV